MRRTLLRLQVVCNRLQVCATYHTSAPKLERFVDVVPNLLNWMNGLKVVQLVQLFLGAGIGKSTLVAEWLNGKQDEQPNLSICWYPCQPWDREVGLAVSLLHRFGIDEKHHDPYNLIETLPLRPGAPLDVDTWRRRLLAYLTDAYTVRERFFDCSGGPPPYWLIILDDVHHIASESRDLLGALLQISQKHRYASYLISRTSLDFYDEEMSIQGISSGIASVWAFFGRNVAVVG